MLKIEEGIEITSQLKIAGDEYSGFYSCGLTMMDSESMRRMKSVEKSVEQKDELDNDGQNVKNNERIDALNAGKNNSRTVMRDDRGIELVVKHIELGAGVYEIQSVITNKGKQSVTLEMADSFSVSGIKADKIHRMTSFWSAEGRLKTDDVKELGLEHSWNHMAYRVEKFGNVGSMPVRRYFPFVALEDSENGRWVAFLLYTPSSWQIEIVCRHDDRLTVNGGIADRDFGAFTKEMTPGDVLDTPKALMAIGNSLEEVCDKLVRAQKPDVSPVDNGMGITFNEYCATWGNPTEENLRKVCDAVAGKGMQYLVMDSGWYGKDDGYWWDYTGEWEININRFPNGLKPVADYIRAKGMIPGIWFEFENVSPKSRYYNREDMLLMKDKVPLSVGGRRFLDMENPKVKEHLREKVIKLLKECGFGYIKIDYNDTMGLGCDGTDGLGENMRRKLLATQEFFRELKREIPELVIENCSSGGHRLEPSMMELSTMASFSDAHEIKSLPIIAANVHRLIKTQQNQIWAVFRAADSDERLYYSICSTLFGRMGLSGDIYDMSDNQWDIIYRGMDFYRSVSDIIRDGYTEVIECNVESYNEPKGGQLVIRHLGNKYLIVYHRFENSVSIEEYIAQHIDILRGKVSDEKVLKINANVLKVNQDELKINPNELKMSKAVIIGSTYGNAACDFSAQAWVVEV